MEELDGIVGGSMTVTLTPVTSKGIPCYRMTIVGDSGGGTKTIPVSRMDEFKEKHPDWTFKMNR